MAIYRLSSKIITRAKGQSAVAAAAYRSGERLRDDTLGLTFDYTKKRGIEHVEIMAPADSPDWIPDRERLWTEVELSETRKNSQLAREIQLALPVELSNESQLELARDFIQAAFVNQGMVADFAIHRDNPDNPHVHVMLTLREIGPDGFGEKRRDWNERDLIYAWRLGWEKAANHYLAREGKSARIDRRSFRDRKLGIQPLPKLARRLEDLEADLDEGKLDVRTQQKLVDYLQIAKSNGEAIIADPTISLKILTEQTVTFRRRDVHRLLNRHTVDDEQFRLADAVIFACPELIPVGKNDRGEDLFTSQATIDAEKSLLASADALMERHGTAVKPGLIKQAIATRSLSEEQEEALRHIAGGDTHLAIVHGIAGSGKSYMLGAARETWEADGRRVLGAALAGKAAEGMEVAAGIRSRSLASWEYALERGREELGENDVFVIDEAGMVGTAMMERMIRRVEAAGAKLVLVGDSQQLQAIEAGSPFHKLAELHGAATMTQSRRQKIEWQRKASGDFFQGRAEDALQAYCDAGHFKAHQSQIDALHGALGAWVEGRRETPEATQLLLAYRRRDVRTLNLLAREQLKVDGALDLTTERSFTVETADGTAKRDFAEGDRIYFLKNNRALGVTNGTLATIKKIEGHDLVVTLDNDTELAFSTKDYNSLDHGYAATIHKAQGVTVDRAYVVADKLLDQHAAYVALSRHREGVELHWSKEEFKGGQAQLLGRLARHQRKEMISDLDLDTFPSLARKAPSPAPKVESKALAEAEPPKLRPPEPNPEFAWFLKLPKVKQDRRLEELRDKATQHQPSVEDFIRALPAYQKELEKTEALDKARTAAREAYARELRATPEWRRKLSRTLPQLKEQVGKATNRWKQSSDRLEAMENNPGFQQHAEDVLGQLRASRLQAAEQRGALIKAREEHRTAQRTFAVRSWIEKEAPGKPVPVRLLQPSNEPVEGTWLGQREIDGALIAALALPDKSLGIVDVTGRKRELDGFKRHQKVTLMPSGRLRASGRSRSRGGIER